MLFVRHEGDGDYHVVVKPDAGFGRFLDHDNYTKQQGGLVTEIMPGQRLPLPNPGEHVRIYGTWVYDADHGWNKVHPIWAITYLDTGHRVVALPPARPRYKPEGGPGTGGASSSGGNCDPSYPTVCLRDGIGDYDCAGGGGNGPNYVRGPIKVLPPDPFRLDSDHNGIGCQ